jgi:hypothetical protein
MAVANQPALPPGASSEGVGRGVSVRVLFNSADRPRKTIVTKLNDLLHVFTSYSTSNAPKTTELCFPCASRSSHLPSILPSVAAASFWLVVAFKIIDRRPFKAVVYFILYIFFDELAAPNDGTVSPHALPAQRASALTPTLPLPPTIGLIVVLNPQTAAT